MTAEFVTIAGGFAIGAVAGSFYFGWLWLTVRGIALARRPQLRLALSFLLRMGALLAVFYALTDHGLAAMVAATAGLLSARQLWLLGKGRIRPARG